MKFLLTTLATATVVFASTASAAVISSVDRATFAANVADGMIAGEDFDGLLAGSLLNMLDGVTYTTTGGDALVTDQFLTTTGDNGIGATGVGFFEGTDTVTFTFDTAITAFAIDVNTFATGDAAYTATLNTGDVVNSLFEVFPNQSTGQFIGFVSDSAFTTLTIAAATGFSFTLDTLVFGDAQDLVFDPVPLPAAGILFVTALAGGAAAKRRKRR